MSLDAYQQLIGLHAERVIEASRKSEIEKMELAKAIGLMPPNARLVEKLDKLISDDSPEVSCYAIKSAARLLREEHLPAIFRKLGHPSVQEDAISALHKYGRSAIGALGEYLTVGGRDAASKRAAVEVLARIGLPEVVPILMRELERESGELDTAVIDALDRIRSARTDIRLPEREVERKTLSLIQKYCRTYIDLQELEAGDRSAERKRLLKRDLEALLADIFKLLGLSYPQEDIRKAWQNLKTESRNSVAYAVELLDNTLKNEMKDVILPLVEDLTPLERLRRIHKILSDLSEKS
jgi:HEAT repeat protein